VCVYPPAIDLLAFLYDEKAASGYAPPYVSFGNAPRRHLLADMLGEGHPIKYLPTQRSIKRLSIRIGRGCVLAQ
jgi:hypothetical protein